MKRDPGQRIEKVSLFGHCFHGTVASYMPADPTYAILNVKTHRKYINYRTRS